MMIPLLLAASITLAPCEVRGVSAQCGTLVVPENPARPIVRTIRLNVAVIPSEKKSEDALFILAGGPGVPATLTASWVKEDFGGVGRDIVLVDARGTGRSNPLRCPVAPSAVADLMAPARIEACRDRLSVWNDLTQYTTHRIVDDLEAVRTALGYSKATLYGTSYGTRVALDYMRRYPDSLRAVVLDGVVPPSFAMPTSYAEYSQRTIRRVFDLCRADATCAKAFPDLEADLAAMLKAAEDGVSVDGVTVRRGFFGEVFRNFLYSSNLYPRMPLAVHSAAKGDWSLFNEMATRYMKGLEGLDLGMLLSVTCTEDLPRIDESAIRKASANTVLGTYRLDQQTAACRIWPHGAADAEMAKPVASSVPTLIVSGELDPVTPPEYGDEVAKTLDRSLHLVIPFGSHSGDTGGCMEKVMVDFMRKGSVEALDTTCVQKLPRPAFLTAVEKPAKPPQKPSQTQ